MMARRFKFSGVFIALMIVMIGWKTNIAYLEFASVALGESGSSGDAYVDYEDGEGKVYTRGSRTEIGDTPWQEPSVFSPRVIYGTDDRIDYYQETDPTRLQQADSTCGLFDNTDVVDNGNGTFTLQTYTYTSGGVVMCAEEPFATQPISAWCTAFLVGPDLIATAGHCYDERDLSTVSFVFGFDMLDASTPVLTMDNENLYTGVEVVGHQLTDDYDYSIIRLDRVVTAPGAEPLPIRRSGTVANGTQIGVIGHPTGLPTKIAFGAQTVVGDNSPAGFFTANLDTYGGNSGSPVFNASTGEVEGILVRGLTDFIDTGSCLVSNELADGVSGEDVSKAATFAQFIPELATRAGKVTFDQESYSCSDSLLLIGMDTDRGSNMGVLVTTSGGDSETMILPKMGVNNGIYTDTLSIVEGIPATQNGTLEIADGDIITVTYNDADDGTGNPAVATDTALINCTLAPDYFTEFFTVGNDLNYTSLTFTPDASRNRYAVCSSPATILPSDMTGATTLFLADDGFQQINLTGGKTVSLFGVDYSSCYVGSNGYITFGIGDIDFDSLISSHFTIPRVSGFFTDFTPANGGTISFKQLSDRLAVAFEGIEEYSFVTSNTFQMELFFDGTIAITHLLTEAEYGIVGISDGLGTPAGFAQSDLSASDDCDALTLRNGFAGFDANGDGLLTLAESGLGASDFNALDTGSNGSLSMAELLDATAGASGSSTDTYVQFDFVGPETGTASNPFSTLFEAESSVATSGNLHITPGTSSEIIVFDNAVTLLRNGSSGTVTLGSP